MILKFVKMGLVKETFSKVIFPAAKCENTVIAFFRFSFIFRLFNVKCRHLGEEKRARGAINAIRA
jgi:hypothetical protein